MAFSDLDALIGDIRREAARRRAAPDFPVDDEARLALEMDHQGPSGGTADLPAVLAAIRALAAAGRRGGGPAGGLGPDPVAELADLAGSALRSLSATVADLQRRLERLVPSLAGPAPAASPAASPAEPGSGQAGEDALDHWRPVVSRVAAAAGPGRAMVAGPGAGPWAEGLAGEGVDVYGVDPTLAVYGDDGMVRAGGVVAHLQTVGEGALTLAVLVGPLAAAELPHLGRWAAALAVRAETVVVVSEAPWAWRLRLGQAGSDTSAWRPAAPETWMAVLDAAGYRLSGRYGPGGRDYCLVAGRGPVEVPGP